MKRTIFASSLITATLLLADPAMAEQATPAATPETPAPAAQPPLPDASDFSEQQLEAFVSSQKALGQIQQKYARKLQATQDDPKAAMAIKQEARQALAGAVQSSGLGEQTYKKIAILARHDAEFRSRLQAML